MSHFLDPFTPVQRPAKQRHRRTLHLMTLEDQLIVIPQSDGDTHLVIDEHYTAADTAIFLANLAKLARTSKSAPHILGLGLHEAFERAFIDKGVCKEGRGLLHKLRRALSVDIRQFRNYFPEHEMHPDIDAAQQAILHAQSLSAGAANDESLRFLLRTLREVSMAPEFVAARRRHSRASGKRVLETKTYINKLFQERSRVLAVRVDLGYRIPSGTHGWGADTSGATTLEQTRQHRLAMMRELRQVLGDCLRGYVVRMEWAPHKSFHYHCYFFLDGHKVQRRTHYANLIGSIWTKTTGNGYHFEPEPCKGARRGTGMFHRDDKEGRRAVVETATYLCKADYYIGFYKGVRHKTFFHGL